jgi:hypothetical protein
MEAQQRQSPAGLLSKLGDLRVASGSKGNAATSALPYDEIVSNLDNILPHWDRIKTGTLPNGLRYYIQPNTVQAALSRPSGRVLDGAAALN